MFWARRADTPEPPLLPRGHRNVLARLAASALVVGALSTACAASRERAACDILTAAILSSALNVTVGPAHPTTAERGGPTDATVCNYQTSVPGESATIFVARRGAGGFYARQLSAARANGGRPRNRSGSGYKAFVSPGPSIGGKATSQSLFLLRRGYYVNAVLYQVPSAALQRLLAETVASIR